MGPDPERQGGLSADPQGSAAPFDASACADRFDGEPVHAPADNGVSANGVRANGVQGDPAHTDPAHTETEHAGADVPDNSSETGADPVFEAKAVSSFLRAKENSAVREARDRARAKRHKAIEEEAIASWLRSRQSS